MKNPGRGGDNKTGRVLRRGIKDAAIAFVIVAPIPRPFKDLSQVFLRTFKFPLNAASKMPFESLSNAF